MNSFSEGVYGDSLLNNVKPHLSCREVVRYSFQKDEGRDSDTVVVLVLLITEKWQASEKSVRASYLCQIGNSQSPVQSMKYLGTVE